MCGVANGPKQWVLVEGNGETRLKTNGDLVEVPDYHGWAVLWMTLQAPHDGDLMGDGYEIGASMGGGHAGYGFVCRVWAETRKQPSLQSPPDPLLLNLPGWKQETDSELRTRLSFAALTAATFAFAEAHPDPKKAISRHEAELILKFEECWTMGVGFLQYTGLLERRASCGPAAWSAQKQAKGLAKYEYMIYLYGKGCFPCAEAVSIAAFYLTQWCRDLPDWLTGDSSNWVAWIFLFIHRIIWRSHGNNKTRNTLTNLPIPYSMVNFTQTEVEEARDSCFHKSRYYEDDEREDERMKWLLWSDLMNLSYISPIANEAVPLSVRIRNPRDMGPEHRRSPIYDSSALAVHNAINVKTASEEEDGDEESDRMETETEAETDTDWGSCCSSSGESEHR